VLRGVLLLRRRKHMRMIEATAMRNIVPPRTMMIIIGTDGVLREMDRFER